MPCFPHCFRAFRPFVGSQPLPARPWLAGVPFENARALLGLAGCHPFSRTAPGPNTPASHPTTCPQQSGSSVSKSTIPNCFSPSPSWDPVLLSPANSRVVRCESHLPYQIVGAGGPSAAPLRVNRLGSQQGQDRKLVPERGRISCFLSG